METVSTHSPRPADHATVQRRVGRIGCVSFLNAKPLIEGLEGGRDPVVKLDVPSRLLADLEADAVDIALCPVIDFQRSTTPLAIVPVGGIGCQGKTLTVRLFSRVPFEAVTQVHADTDSHTSVALMRVLLAEIYGRQAQVIDYDARRGAVPPPSTQPPQTVLLIGDKVVTACPPESLYPYQLDLGEAWQAHTGLPFVFAVWMARAEAPLGDLPQLLAQTRLGNAGRMADIVTRHAAAHAWPHDLAMQYLGQWLHYDIGEPQLQAMRLFYEKAHQHGLIPRLRPLRIWKEVTGMNTNEHG
ncbi:MAG: menaquinone biosynthesis protein [Phycisphaeraceae bacterium]